MTDTAGIRFAYGFGPAHPPVPVRRLLNDLKKPDDMVSRFPVMTTSQALREGQAFRKAGKAAQAGDAAAQARYETLRMSLRNAVTSGLRSSVARMLDTQAPLRERLVWFWADHFTAAPDNLVLRAGAVSYVDEAIRPYVTGYFADMLKAVVRQPAMLSYLDQAVSFGPASPLAARTGRGLNENFARELLELHTMGAGSGYTQQDVRAAAELLTGLTVNPKTGFVFRPAGAQPGAETVLGRSYGSDKRARPGDIDAFLDDLAARPETARHIARKLAVHFVADTPPGSLVADLAESYSASGGNLMAVTRTLAEHPQTASAPLRKVRQPLEFIVSALRAFGLTGAQISTLPARDMRRMLVRPLAQMGQPFMRPPGPDGWPEAPSHWITPQGLAARISWSRALTGRLEDSVSDPRQFLEQVLPGIAGPDLRFAVPAAETRAEGITMVLVSSEFNRR
ncbi:DUF1800 domain-containing protein [uncultured Roseobacter sp.]|uniref:DUF1800 domain-containing protein n=1 Tax=uncultured Roseobacter sp. TaxID=114847 RepID=UPI0026368FFF|nr:DUF1800 domain-containing protein [uncultured Roseobacter sp.]